MAGGRRVVHRLRQLIDVVLPPRPWHSTGSHRVNDEHGRDVGVASYSSWYCESKGSTLLQLFIRSLLALAVGCVGLCVFSRDLVSPIPTQDVSAALPQSYAGQDPNSAEKGSSHWQWNVKSCRSGHGYSAWWDIKDSEKMVAAIQDEAKACVSAGINTVVLESRYILGVPGDRTFWSCPPLDLMIPRVRKYVEIAHAHGLRVIGHLTVYIASDDYATRHPEHRQWNVVTGKPAAGYPDTSFWKNATTVCYNNPEFQAVYRKSVKRLLVRTGVDGFMVDEVQFISSAADRWTCGCKHCRTEFTRDSGYVLPSGQKAKTILGDRGNPIFRAWFKWRIKQNGDFYEMLRRAMDEQGGQDKILFGCFSMPSQFGNDLELESMSRSWNLMFTESQPGSPHMLYFHNYLSVIADMKYALAAAVHQDTSFFTLFYNQSPDAEAFTWLLGMSQGSGYFFQMGVDRFSPQLTSLSLWEKKLAGLRTSLKPLASVAVLYPSTTRTVADPQVYMNFFGWCNTLTDQQVSYNVLMEKDLTPVHLAKYNVLVLPNSLALSSGQNQTIGQFVESGGTLIATGQTSLYDETGAQRSEFGLSKVLGVRYVDDVAPPNTIVSSANSLVARSLGESFVNETSHVTVQPIAKSLQVLARVRDAAGNTSPSVTVNRFGRGRAVHIGFQPDVKAAVSSVGGGAHPGKVFVDPRVPECAKLLTNLVKSQCDNPTIVAENIPPGVVVQGYTHSAGMQPGTFLTLLNCIGGRLTRTRTQIPDDYRTSFPSVLDRVPDGTKMKLRIKASNVNAAYLVSPDIDEVVQLKFTAMPKGYVAVVIPDLDRFAIVYLNRGRRDVIRETFKSVVTEYPKGN